MSDLFLQEETTRVQLHFANAEKNLLSKDITQLPEHIKSNRQNHIETLHNYAQAGVFPRNYFSDKQVPCFIDIENRPCAVAHLMMTSGREALSHKISAIANYALVPEIAELKLNEVEEWVKESGFSLEELAMIQPTYRRGGSYGERRRIVLSKQEKSEKNGGSDEDKSQGMREISSPSTQTSEQAYSKNTEEIKPETK